MVYTYISLYSYYISTVHLKIYTLAGVIHSWHNLSFMAPLRAKHWLRTLAKYI